MRCVFKPNDGSFHGSSFSHVIFDLDGTILNTLEDLAAASNHTCETHGWPRLP